MVEQTIEMPVIWDAIGLIMTSLQWIPKILYVLGHHLNMSRDSTVQSLYMAVILL